MNQMVASLYVNKTASTATSKQDNSNVQMETSAKPEEEQQQAKRKQSSEKSVKKVKRKRPIDSSPSNDIEGNNHQRFLLE